MDDQDANIDEVLVETSTKLVSNSNPSSTDYLADSKSPIVAKRSASESSESFSPNYTVYDSEVASSFRYKQNLKKFLNDIKAPTDLSSLQNERKKSKQKTTIYKKLFKSEGTLSNFLHYWGVSSRISSVIQKLNKRYSKSAPPSFDDTSNPEEINVLYDTNESGDSEPNIITNPKTVDILGLFRNKTTDVPEKSISENETLCTTLTDASICELSSQPLTNLLEREITAGPSGEFKIPKLPINSPKSNRGEKLGLSPGNTKVDVKNQEKSPFDSFQRPSDLNVSPRRSVFLFCPGSPTGILRQCRSLPNISRTPRKKLRRASMSFENYSRNFSVKGHLTSEMTSKKDDSSVSYAVEESTKIDMPSLSTNDDNTDNFSQSAFNLSGKTKLRKKLVFSSDTSEKSNITHTLQDSSSLDISTDVSNLDIADEERIPSVKITLIESPKRKHFKSELNKPQSSCSLPKKVCLLDEQVNTDDEICGSLEVENAELFGAKLKDTTGHNPVCDAEKTENVPGSSTTSPNYVVTHSKSKSPTVEFPDDDEDCLKSNRLLLKRTITSSDIVEDITELSESKRKKD